MYSACTAAFLAKSKTSSNIYLMTAGHCGTAVRGATWLTNILVNVREYSGNWVSIGKISKRTIGSGGDRAIIRVNDPSKLCGSCKHGWVDTDGRWDRSPNRDFPDRDGYPIRKTAKPIVGATVCFEGKTSTWTKCGKISAINTTTRYRRIGEVRGLFTITGSRSENCSLPGDSGGPVFSKNVAYGIMSGSQTFDEGVTCTWLSFVEPIRRAEDKFGVSIVKEAG